jgi:hypothetical protein
VAFYLSILKFELAGLARVGSILVVLHHPCLDKIRTLAAAMVGTAVAQTHTQRIRGAIQQYRMVSS